MAEKQDPHEVEIVHPDYQLRAAELNEDMRVDATFDEAVGALTKPVKIRYIDRRNPSTETLRAGNGRADKGSGGGSPSCLGAGTARCQPRIFGTFPVVCHVSIFGYGLLDFMEHHGMANCQTVAPVARKTRGDGTLGTKAFNVRCVSFRDGYFHTACCAWY